MKRRKGFWIGTAFILLMFAFYCFLCFQNSATEFNPYLAYAVIVILIVDLYYVIFFAFILEKKLKKAPSLNAVAEYEFAEDEITEVLVSEYLDQKLNCKYDTIYLITENEDYLYIYIAQNQAFIVDKNGFTEGSLYDLKVFLSQKIDAKKIKYSVNIY